MRLLCIALICCAGLSSTTTAAQPAPLHQLPVDDVWQHPFVEPASQSAMGCVLVGLAPAIVNVGGWVMLGPACLAGVGSQNCGTAALTMMMSLGALAGGVVVAAAGVLGVWIGLGVGMVDAHDAGRFDVFEHLLPFVLSVVVGTAGLLGGAAFALWWASVVTDINAGRSSRASARGQLAGALLVGALAPSLAAPAAALTAASTRWAVASLKASGWTPMSGTDDDDAPAPGALPPPAPLHPDDDVDAPEAPPAPEDRVLFPSLSLSMAF